MESHKSLSLNGLGVCGFLRLYNLVLLPTPVSRLNSSGFRVSVTELLTRYLSITYFPNWELCMRRAMPWYWKARKCWYVQVDGKQIKLDPDENKAWKLYGRLLATSGKLASNERQSLTVPEVADLYLDHSDIAASTRETYTYVLTNFAEAMSKPIMGLTKADVVGYCNARAWKDGYRKLVYSIIQAMTKWCRDKGYLQLDPLASERNPFAPSIRETVLTRAQLEKLLGVVSRNFGLVMRVLWYTGCRPGETCKLQARHLHPTEPVAELSAREQKTGRKTGRSRKIVFPASIMSEIRLLIEGAQPDSYVLTNNSGGPWTTQAIYKRFRKAIKDAALPRDLVPYSSRHGFATDGIMRGESTALLAQAMGHTNDATIQRHYLHATNQGISEIVERRAEPKKKPSKVALQDEIKLLSARLAELTAKILDGD